MKVKRHLWIIWLSLLLALADVFFVIPPVLRGMIRASLPQEQRQIAEASDGKGHQDGIRNPDWDHAQTAEFHEDGVDVVLTLPGNWDFACSEGAQRDENGRLPCISFWPKEEPEWHFTLSYTDAFQFEDLQGNNLLHLNIPGSTKAMQVTEDQKETMVLFLDSLDQYTDAGRRVFYLEMDSDRTQTLDYYSYVDPAAKEILTRSSWTAQK